MTFNEMVEAVMCGYGSAEDTLEEFCAERGIEEGGWFFDGELRYEDWTNGVDYRLNVGQI